MAEVRLSEFPCPSVCRVRRVPEGLLLETIGADLVACKFAFGKLLLPLPPTVWFADSCARRGITPLPITDSVAMRAALLPLYHRDPSDRFIIATAQDQDLTIITSDATFGAYDVKIIWD